MIKLFLEGAPAHRRLHKRIQTMSYQEESMMKFSKEELCNMKFTDVFKLKEPDEDEEEDCCMICGNKLENLKIS